ncbi:uncharacterized protein EI90DRAFT_2441042 [Cantharellus anzutake]|uniref:uncharacterized protein n=1 Tax=Cantharellus anzutake TaxID=1750568 RepID=UPI001908C01B|nr:uncharacterized protein EI90DRAFT_2441042 [Cantharellus anzutake]KAF8339010.1 hypothetical protein EI90DRAFT_2441042 [Cantharellus anzutake]
MGGVITSGANRICAEPSNHNETIWMPFIRAHVVLPKGHAAIYLRPTLPAHWHCREVAKITTVRRIHNAEQTAPEPPLTAKKQLARIRDHLRNGDYARAFGAILKPPSDINSLSPWYEKCIAFLLSRGEVSVATRVVIKALEERSPLRSRTLRSVLGAAAHACYQAWPAEGKEADSEEKPIIIEQSIKSFYILHQKLLETRTRIELLDWLTKYVNDNDLDWSGSAAITSIFIRASVISDGYKSAYRWFHRFRRHSNLGDEDALARADPYVALMSSRARTHPLDFAFQQRMLRMLIKDRVMPTLPVFNISMSAAGRANQPRIVYDLYFLMRMHAPHLIPDSFTFATLFKTMDRFSPVSRHPKLPHARHIFRHLIDTHLFLAYGDPTVRTRTLTVSVLNVGLRHFMRVRQYSAALVVLRCLELCELVPNRRTEWIINSFILRRINGELYAGYPFEYGSDPSRPTWAELFTETILHTPFRENLVSNPDATSYDWCGFSRDRTAIENRLEANLFALVKVNRPNPNAGSRHKAVGGTVTRTLASDKESRSQAEEAADGGERVDVPLDLLISTVRNCAIAEAGIRPSSQTQTQRDATIRRLMLEKDRIMFPRKPGGRMRKHPFRLPVLGLDEIADGLQGGLVDIDNKDEYYDELDGQTI